MGRGGGICPAPSRLLCLLRHPRVPWLSAAGLRRSGDCGPPAACALLALWPSEGIFLCSGFLPFAPGRDYYHDVIVPHRLKGGNLERVCLGAVVLVDSLKTQ